MLGEGIEDVTPGGFYRVQPWYRDWIQVHGAGFREAGPGHVVERARTRVRAQDDQRDRRNADQHQEQHHGPAAERVVPDPVAEREQIVDLPGGSLLSRRVRRVSGHSRVISPTLRCLVPP